MAENYCGKNCDECTYKEELNCPGCANGPGDTWTGNCKIAKCCDDKGHKSCSSCGFKDGCGMLKRKHLIPQDRIKDNEAESEKNERIKKMLPTLTKWLPVLFWTSIISIIAEFFTDDSLKSWFMKLYYTANFVQIACSIFYGIVLLKMSTASLWYKTAGTFMLIGPCVALASAILIALTDLPLFIILSIAALILTLYGKYCQFQGHAAILLDVDEYLSYKWEKLWKLYLISYAAMIGSILIVFISAVLGILVSVAASIFGLVVGILEFVYLYKTSKTFKHIQQFYTNDK